MLRQERKQEVIALCQSLIQQRSYSGDEAKVAAVLSDTMRSLCG